MLLISLSATIYYLCFLQNICKCCKTYKRSIIIHCDISILLNLYHIFPCNLSFTCLGSTEICKHKKGVLKVCLFDMDILHTLKYRPSHFLLEGAIVVLVSS